MLEGLRRVISMTYRASPSQPTLPYFSSVIKNIASPNIEVKKLVYIYLLHHAEQEPDTALLSINTIQKSLSDSNPQVRAMALRVISGIRVPVISQIVSLGIKKGAGDMSPYVRRAAALAIPKCYRLDPATLPQLLDQLSVLLGDKQFFVAGSAVAAFLDICPERIDLIHPHYRSLVRKVVDMDEWGQLATLRLLTMYARKCFPRRTRKVKKTVSAHQQASKDTSTAKGFYDDEPTDDANQPHHTSDSYFDEAVVDTDHSLLLNSMQPLLQSRNSAVILAVARAYLLLSPPDTPKYLHSAVGPLIALLRSPSDIQHIALYDIVQVALQHPSLFMPYYNHFLIRVASDSPNIRSLKLELQTLLFPHAPPHIKSLILTELSHFARSTQDAGLVRESVRAIGRCAQAADPKTSSRCLRLLLQLLSSASGTLVAEALEVIRHLILQDPDAHVGTVTRLAKHLDVTSSPQARASIIWLVGEFSGVSGGDNVSADVLRILAKGFAGESCQAKLQIILLAGKVYLHHISRLNEHDDSKFNLENSEPSQDGVDGDEGGYIGRKHPRVDDNGLALVSESHPIAVLWRYILLLARYDTSYDLRDRTRVYRALLSVPSSTGLASLLLLAPKPVPQIPSPSETRKDYQLGSASLVIGDESGVSGLRGYWRVPDWVQDGAEPDPRLREDGGKERKGEYEPQRVLPASERLDTAMREQGIDILEGRAINGGPPKAQKSLDDWLAEEEEEDDDDEGEEDETEEGSEETDDGETDEDDGEEEEDDSEDERGRLVK